MDENIFIFFAVGFIAQTIDGALGMAYGVCSNTFLLSIGIPPAIASASVHLAEVFTTAISGISHWRLGNVDKELLKKLVIPGVIGGSLGAYLLTSLPGDKLKPFIAIYLLFMGIVILAKAIGKKPENKQVVTKLPVLGLIGGFLDAMGGGGWGPTVTSTLVARGNNPRYSIGSVNMSEFFVTLAESVMFLITLRYVHWQSVLGLMIGGALAAPFAAMVTKRLPTRKLLGFLGGLIVLLSLRTILLALV